ncbi:MAG: ankyrin repeat domain-containing protein [Planctomycetota bacterium]
MYIYNKLKFHFLIFILFSNTAYLYADSSLITLVRSGNLGQIINAVNNGSDVNQKDSDGWNALMQASFEKNYSIAEFLIDKGVDINAIDNNGITALMVAAGEKSREIVQLLIDSGADVNKQSKKGLTALIASVSNNYLTIAEILLKMGADINLNMNGITSLSIAENNGYKEMVALLKKYNAADKIADSFISGTEEEAHADIIKDIRNKNSKLIEASMNNSVEIAQMLIRNGADVNTANVYGITPLMWASYSNFYVLAEVLIKNGADVNSKDRDGVTSLMFASGSNSLEVAELLIRSGADINAMSNHGVTALMSADSHGHKEMLALLMKHGAKNRWLVY